LACTESSEALGLGTFGLPPRRRCIELNYSGWCSLKIIIFLKALLSVLSRTYYGTVSITYDSESRFLSFARNRREPSPAFRVLFAVGGHTRKRKAVPRRSVSACWRMAPAQVAEALGLGNRSSATSFLKLKLEVESCPQLHCWLMRSPRFSVPRPVCPRRCASCCQFGRCQFE
jgi:hypothetical protein